MHICVYLHVSVCTMCVCLQKSAENTGSLQTGVLDDCEKLCGCWELDLGPLLEQQVPLPAESSLQSHPSSVFDESVFKKPPDSLCYLLNSLLSQLRDRKQGVAVVFDLPIC